VKVESTVELPRHYTADSIYLDLMADPKAREIITAFMKKTMEIFGHEETEQDGKEAAKEAISEDMTLAMMKYMPLRGAMSFGGGADSSRTMEDLLKKLNGEG
jgi:beta-glucosidase